MPKISWNTFAGKHPTAEGFVTKVSSKLPNGPHFDKKKKRLPTPSGLLQEWLRQNLSGDWCAMTNRGVIALRIATPTDIAVLTTEFPARGAPQSSPFATSTTQIDYSDSDYGPLAKSLGYDV